MERLFLGFEEEAKEVDNFINNSLYYLVWQKKKK